MVKAKLQPQGRQESEPLRELKLACMNNLLSTTEERVYFKDLQSRFLFVSAGWIAAYTPGQATEELIGKTDFDVFSDGHASAAFEDEQEIIRTGNPLVGQVERETYSGRPDAWASTTKMPLRDERGRIIGTFGITRAAAAAGVTEGNAQRLLRLVGDLLFLSRIQSGKMAVEFRSADLADIAVQAVEEMRPEAQRKHIDLAFSAAAVPCLAVDPTRIAQLLGNLISNAVKFTPDGGRVEVRLGVEGDQAVLAVADTGIGIPAADRAFRPSASQATSITSAARTSPPISSSLPKVTSSSTAISNPACL